MGLGKHAYNVILYVLGDIGPMRTAWIRGFILAARAAVIFAGFVTIFINPIHHRVIGLTFSFS